MRPSLLLTTAALAVASCGAGDAATADEPGGSAAAAPAPATTQTAAAAAATAKPAPAARPAAKGTRIDLRSTRFGKILLDARRRAIYIFENDRRDRTVCYGDCAEAWPPVYTKGRPRAGSGVRRSLLGTIRRRDGRLQVTYAGKPLYFYAHEGPGEVRCHNVDLNGGLWWVVGANGKRRP